MWLYVVFPYMHIMWSNPIELEKVETKLCVDCHLETKLTSFSTVASCSIFPRCLKQSLKQSGIWDSAQFPLSLFFSLSPPIVTLKSAFPYPLRLYMFHSLPGMSFLLFTCYFTKVGSAQTPFLLKTFMTIINNPQFSVS
jgi:hypothetical protein